MSRGDYKAIYLTVEQHTWLRAVAAYRRVPIAVVGREVFDLGQLAYAKDHINELWDEAEEFIKASPSSQVAELDAEPGSMRFLRDNDLIDLALGEGEG